MSLKIRLIDDPILRKPCEPIDVWTANVLFDIDKLLDAMNSTMRAEQGVGLAANQVGYSIRVFILKDNATYKVFINPEIVSQSEPVDFEGEGCLSIPGASAMTKRYRQIRLKWVCRDGINREADFLDSEAFAVQHEMDHLDGKLYVDQLGPLRRELVLNKHKKYLKFRR